MFRALASRQSEAAILVKSHGILGLSWQYHHPPIQYSVCSKCPSWSNTVCGEGVGQVLGKSCFRHRTRGDNENIAKFQGVPCTFYLDHSTRNVSYFLFHSNPKPIFTTQVITQVCVPPRQHHQPSSLKRWHYTIPDMLPTHHLKLDFQYKAIFLHQSAEQNNKDQSNVKDPCEPTCEFINAWNSQLWSKDFPADRSYKI